MASSVHARLSATQQTLSYNSNPDPAASSQDLLRAQQPAQLSRFMQETQRTEVSAVCSGSSAGKLWLHHVRTQHLQFSSSNSSLVRSAYSYWHRALVIPSMNSCHWLSLLYELLNSSFGDPYCSYGSLHIRICGNKVFTLWATLC